MKDIVVLDACVLYGAYTRDLLLTFAYEGLYIGNWSEKILEEYAGNLNKNRPDLLEKTERTLNIIKESFPDSIVEGYEHLEQSLTLPDPDDRHVLAAAIHSESQYIVTNNLKDFPGNHLDKFGIKAISCDQFLSGIITRHPDRSKEAFIQMVNRFKKDPKTPEAVIEKLANDQLPLTADLLRSIFQT